MNNSYNFNEEDYSSDNGMMTAIWGPPLWFTLHTISFNYPVNPTEEDKRRYYKYFKYLGKVLPCRYCRENFSKNLEGTNFNYKVFDNRDTLSRWVYNLHEHVNSMLGKESKLSYEQVRDRFENFRARCLANDKPEKNVKEKGCTNPKHGIKSQCVLNIVPKDKRKSSFKMDKKCQIK